jgi:hypothetical protein
VHLSCIYPFARRCYAYPRTITIRYREGRQTFQFSINHTSGLSERVCAEWQRRSFSQSPDELIQFHNVKYTPTAKGGVPAGAKTAVIALIAYLKKKQSEGSRQGSGPGHGY